MIDRDADHADATGADPGPSRCPICDRSAGWETITVREMMFGTRTAYRYGRCGACASLVIAAVPTDLASHYPDRYYDNRPPPIIEDGPLRRAAIRVLVREKAFGLRGPLPWLARRTGPLPIAEYRQVRALITGAALKSFDDPIIDVGCGRSPVRLAMLRKLGYRNLLGIEPFIDHDTTYRGVPIRKGDVDDVEGSFRLIMFHHSLEHVPTPLRVLRDARERIRPDGWCLVRTPVIGGDPWREYGTDWVELDAPRHLVVFSAAGLSALARRAGFEIARITWESTAWDYLASDRYRQDVPLHEPGSPPEDLMSTSDPDMIAAYDARARRANAAGDAGRAAFWLRPIAADGASPRPRD